MLAVLLAAALLVVILGPHRIGDYMAETDFYGAYALGARLVEHGQLIPSRYGVVGPGYEVLLGLAGFAIPDLFFAAELLSLAATLATLLLWFELLRRRLDARIGLAAVALYAVNTYVFRYGYSATTDAVSVALQSAALFSLFAGRGPRSLLGAGLFAAAAFLTRYNAIYLLPGGLLAIVAGASGAQVLATGSLAPPGDRGATAGATPDSLRPRTPRRLVALGLFAAGFFAPVVPWVLFSLARGSGFSFQLHHNVAYEVFARSKGMAWDDYQKYLQPQFHNLWDVIRRDPGAVAGRMGLNVVGHLRDDGLKLLGPWTAACALAGLALACFDRRLRGLWPLWVAGALLFLTLVPAFYSERYSLALAPIYAALAGIAFGVPRLAIVAGGRVWLKALVIVLPLGFALTANWKHQAHAFTQLPTEVLKASAVLRRLKRPGDRVITRKAQIAFHAGVEAAPFPFADSLPALAEGARREGARWLYFSWPEAETRPAFWHLLDTTGVVPGLTPRCVTSPHPSVLYEIGPEFGRVPAWFRNDTLRAWHSVTARLMVDAHDARLLASRAALARVMGRLDEARAAVQAALAVNPNQLEALLELGAIAYDMHDPELSISALEHAVQTHPESSEARLSLGWAYLDAGRASEAAAVWRDVVNTTNDVSTLRRMSLVFRQLGDAASAAQAEAGLARLGATR